MFKQLPKQYSSSSGSVTRRSKAAVLGIVLGVSQLGFGAQRPATPPLPSDDEEPVRLETTLVQVPVVVTGKGGLYVTDLRQEEFSIFEDGRQQRIDFFRTIEEPFNVALLLDSSGSTADQLAMMKDAANAFIDNLRPHDRVIVISFNDSVQVLCNLTNERHVLRSAVHRISPGEYTQVYEVVYTAVWERLEKIQGRKAVILFSDGIDTASSEISREDTLDAVVESEDVIVYPIRYSTRWDVERRLEARDRRLSVQHTAGDNTSWDRGQLDRLYRSADEYLFELAELSGGKLERADSISDLDAAFARIADELRHQYLLGYHPSNSKKEDRTRKILVRVHREDVTVRTRPGYRVSR